MESAASFGPLRPTNFVNFAERREARPIFGGAGQPFFCGAGRTSLVYNTQLGRGLAHSLLEFFEILY